MSTPASSDAIRIAPADPGSWPTVRTLRLAALADSPGAFASTLAREQAFPDEEWQRRVADGHWWLALAPAPSPSCSPAPVGLVAALVEGADRHLVALWVDPAYRATGAGAALVTAVIEWARDGDAAGVRLWVVDTNRAAVALYDRLGFRPTGARQPVPSDPALLEHERRLVLGPSAPAAPSRPG